MMRPGTSHRAKHRGMEGYIRRAGKAWTRCEDLPFFASKCLESLDSKDNGSSIFAERRESGIVVAHGEVCHCAEWNAKTGISIR